MCDNVFFLFLRSTNWSSLATVWVLVLPPFWLYFCAVPSLPCGVTHSLHQEAYSGQAEQSELTMYQTLPNPDFPNCDSNPNLPQSQLFPTLIPTPNHSNPNSKPPATNPGNLGVPKLWHFWADGPCTLLLHLEVEFFNYQPNPMSTPTQLNPSLPEDPLFFKCFFYYWAEGKRHIFCWMFYFIIFTIVGAEPNRFWGLKGRL